MFCLQIRQNYVPKQNSKSLLLSAKSKKKSNNIYKKNKKYDGENKTKKNVCWENTYSTVLTVNLAGEMLLANEC